MSWRRLAKWLIALTTIVLSLLLSTASLADSAVVPAAGANEPSVKSVPSAKELSHKQDERRPDEQFQITLFGRPLTIGGEYEFGPVHRRNFSLGRRDDDLLRLDQELELELFYQWSADINVFLQGKYKHRNNLYVEGKPSSIDDRVERGEAWIYWSNLFDGHWGIQLGRQNIEEKREWWWEDDLDLIRLHYATGDFSAAFAVGEELGSLSAEKELEADRRDIFRILAHGSWAWKKRQRLELFWLHQNDRSDTPASGTLLPDSGEDEIDADLTWYGLRAIGRINHKATGRYHYWIDSAYVRGEQAIIDFDSAGSGLIEVDTIDHEKISGWALDLGVTWETVLPAEVSFTFGYARGSGDKNSKDARNGRYQQTGLHDNSGKFRGVNRFRYYGELLQPELSNLNILTLSVGFPMLSNSSVEIPLHYYRQVDASRNLRNTRLRNRPDGINRSIGMGLDVVIGIEEWQQLELGFVASVFRAGTAFGSRSGRYANSVAFKLSYSF